MSNKELLLLVLAATIASLAIRLIINRTPGFGNTLGYQVQPAILKQATGSSS